MSGQVDAFDAVLGLALLWLAWRVVTTRDLFKSIVLFIVFGLLMALAWARLHAPDIALAEAAIGAGLTGALLLNALSGFRGDDTDFPDAEAMRRHAPMWVPLLLAAPLGIALAAALGHLPLAPESLSEEVGAEMPKSGVVHPLTAVLLNFRGYDTMLEIGVMLMAAIGARALLRERAAAGSIPRREPLPVLLTLGRLLFPAMVVVSGYLLWSGAHQPGGAFQAGAVLAAGGVMLLLANLLPSRLRHGWALRLTIALGFVVFLGVAAEMLVMNRHLLEYPVDSAGLFILLVEGALTISIALILFALYASVQEQGSHGEEFS